MKQQLFNHWSETKYLKDIVTNPMIEVGITRTTLVITIVIILKTGASDIFGETNRQESYLTRSKILGGI